jgi:hypothetical protein
MATGKTKDQFANKFYGTVTESAANTLTFGEIKTNVSVFDKVAWILHRLEWYPTKALMDLVLNTADFFEAAITSSDGLTSLGLDNAGVIDVLSYGVREASAVGFQYHVEPVIRDFSNLPGGGLIIAPRPLYLALKGTSLTAAGSINCRGYFTVKAMTADEYLELVDFYRIVK